MATARFTIEVDDRGTPTLRRIEQATAKLGDTIQHVGDTGQQFAAKVRPAFEQVAKAAGSASSAVKRLGQDAETTQQIGQALALLSRTFPRLTHAVRGGGEVLALFAQQSRGSLLASTALAGGLTALSGVIGGRVLRSTQSAVREFAHLETELFIVGKAARTFEAATGQAAGSTEEWARELRQLSAGSGILFGELARGLTILFETSRVTGLAREQVQQLLERSVDLSVALGRPFTEVLQRITRGLEGFHQSARLIGLRLDDATVAQHQFGISGKAFADTITESERRTARFNELLAQTESTVGLAAAAVGETFTGQLNRANVAMVNLVTAFGAGAAQVEGPVVQAFGAVASRAEGVTLPLAKLAGAAAQIVGSFLKVTAVVAAAAAAFGAFRLAVAAARLPAIATVLGQFATQFGSVRLAAATVGAALRDLLVPGLAAIAALLRSVVLAATPVVAKFAVLGIAALGIVEAVRQLDREFDISGTVARAAAGAYEAVASAARTVADALGLLGLELPSVTEFVRELGGRVAAGWAFSFGVVADTIGLVADALGQLIGFLPGLGQMSESLQQLAATFRDAAEGAREGGFAILAGLDVAPVQRAGAPRRGGPGPSGVGPGNVADLDEELVQRLGALRREAEQAARGMSALDRELDAQAQAFGAAAAEARGYQDTIREANVREELALQLGEARAAVERLIDPTTASRHAFDALVRTFRLTAAESARLRPALEELHRTQQLVAQIEFSRSIVEQLEEAVDPAMRFQHALEADLRKMKELEAFDLEPAIRQLHEMERTAGAFFDVFGAAEQGFTDVFDALIAGTRSVSDAFEGLKLSIIRSLAEAFIEGLKKKVGFETAFKVNLVQFIGNVGSILGGLFSGRGVGGGGGIGGLVGSLLQGVIFGGGGGILGGGGGGGLLGGLLGGTGSGGSLGSFASGGGILGLLGLGGGAFGLGAGAVGAIGVSQLPAAALGGVFIPGITPAAGVGVLPAGQALSASGAVVPSLSGTGASSGAAGTGAGAAGLGAGGIAAIAIAGAIISAIGSLGFVNRFGTARGPSLFQSFTTPNLIKAGIAAEQGDFGSALAFSADPLQSLAFARSFGLDPLGLGGDRRDFQREFAERIADILARRRDVAGGQRFGQRTFAGGVGPGNFRGLSDASIAFGAALGGFGPGAEPAFAVELARAAEQSGLDVLRALRALGIGVKRAFEGINRTFEGGAESARTYAKAVRGVVDVFTGLPEASGLAITNRLLEDGKVRAREARELNRALKASVEDVRRAIVGAGGDLNTFVNTLVEGVQQRFANLFSRRLTRRGSPLRNALVDPLFTFEDELRRSTRRRSEGGREITPAEFERIAAAVEAAGARAGAVIKEAGAALKAANEVGLRFAVQLRLAAGDVQGAIAELEQGLGALRASIDSARALSDVLAAGIGGDAIARGRAQATILQRRADAAEAGLLGFAGVGSLAELTGSQALIDDAETALRLLNEFGAARIAQLEAEHQLAQELRDFFEGLRSAFRSVADQVEEILRGPRGTRDVLSRDRQRAEELARTIRDAATPEVERRRSLAELANLLPSILQRAQATFAPGSPAFQDFVEFVGTLAREFEGLTGGQADAAAAEMTRAADAFEALARDLKPALDFFAAQGQAALQAKFDDLVLAIGENTAALRALAAALGVEFHAPPPGAGGGGGGGGGGDPAPAGEAGVTVQRGPGGVSAAFDGRQRSLEEGRWVRLGPHRWAKLEGGRVLVWIGRNPPGPAGGPGAAGHAGAPIDLPIPIAAGFAAPEEGLDAPRVGLTFGGGAASQAPVVAGGVEAGPAGAAAEATPSFAAGVGPLTVNLTVNAARDPEETGREVLRVLRARALPELVTEIQRVLR